MTNGNRVAFAPFALKEVGDGTLWSFDEIYGKQGLYRNGAPFTPSIGAAAVTSARFPGALPPLSLTYGHYRHNYADGGYADASGVTTALEILGGVRRISSDVEGSKHVSVVPRLVMITFDYTAVTPENSDDTTFVETLAPLNAVMSVRSNLGDKAITRALALPHTQETVDSEIVRISVDPEEFGLALGFQFSRTSYEILSVLIGKREWCNEPKYAGKNIILANSCAAHRIITDLQ
jgi:hypothetical protein